MLEGPRLAEEYSTSSAFALETSFCRARPVAFNDFFGNGSQSGVHRQAAKITGAGNGTGGRDARKRKNQSIRFLRRLALSLSYFRDLRSVLLTCILSGLFVWWYLLPEPPLVQPAACCSAEYANAIREAMNCPFLQLGFPCVHPNQTHEMISEAFRQPDVFDPLKLQPANRTVALAVMVGVVLLQSPLYLPATSKIQSTAAQPRIEFITTVQHHLSNHHAIGGNLGSCWD